MTNDEFLRKALENIAILRDRLRKESTRRMATLPDLSSNFSGDAYVDSIGTVVRFESGSSNYFYTPTATEMIDRTYGRESGIRDAFFDAIASQMPAPARVLNIGAGGDTAPIVSFQKCGHEVICTDMAEDTIRALREKIDVPAFACDLLHLDAVLPEPVDFTIGNSVLGYLDPGKMKRIIHNVGCSFARGGAFTFDLAPHPNYFQMIDERKQQTLVNSSDPDPAKLLQYINQYGRQDGINAMAYYAHCRGVAMGLAVISLLRLLFEEANMRCVTGARADRVTTFTLRVSKDHDAILEPTDGEVIYQNPDTYFDQYASMNHPQYVMHAVDRISGELLAEELGIHRDQRSDPWLVAEHVARTQDSSLLPVAIRQQVLAEMTPTIYLDKIRPYVEGKRLPVSRRLPRAVRIDQVFHKMVITGAAPFGRAEADTHIDAAYMTPDVERINDYRNALRNPDGAQHAANKVRFGRKKPKTDGKKRRK